jgi:Mn-dependent DtxR family transcriptional regulator
MSAVQRPPKSYAIPPRTHALLMTYVEPMCADQHFWSILLSFANRDGYTEDDLWMMLGSPQHPGARVLHRRIRRNEARARQWFSRQWAKAQQRVADHPAVGDEFEVQFILSQIAEEAALRPDLWSGRAGASRRLAFDTLIHFARKAKNLDVRCSGYQASEFMLRRPETAGDALRWLNEHCPLVELLEPSIRDPRGSLYRLKLPDARNRVSRSPAPPTVGTDTAMQPVHEVFSAAGLGASAGRVYRALSDASAGDATQSPVGDEEEDSLPARAGRRAVRLNTPSKKPRSICASSHRPRRCNCPRYLWAVGGADGLTLADLAAVLGVHPSTVSRALKKLARYRLVAYDPSTRLVYRDASRDLDDVARLLQVDGSRSQRRAVHERRREGYREYIGLKTVETEDGRRLVVEKRTGEIVIEEQSHEPMPGNGRVRRALPR